MKAAVIFQSGGYIATLTRAGLIVERTVPRKGVRGVRLPPDNCQFLAYVDALRDAIDRQEGDALCAALFQP